MICLNYTNKQTKTIIKEALKILNRGTDAWEQYGWRFIGDGLSKQAFVKGSVIVKFGPYDQIEDEYKRWIKYRGSRLRKYLARVYGIFDANSLHCLSDDEGVLIQRRVPGVPKNKQECWCEKGLVIAEKISFTIDNLHNHGHDRRGNPIFFDTDLF